MAETKSEATIRRVNNLIGIFKSQIDAIIEENAEFNPETDDAFGLLHNKRQLEEIYPKYQEAVTTLTAALATNQLAEHKVLLKDFDRAYKKAIVEIQRHLKSIESEDEGEEEDKEDPPHQKIKLPEIRLPTFGGEYEKWISFRDKFGSLVGNNAALSDAQKLQYLQSVLERDALSVQSENDTFVSLWEALTSRYENNNLIVSRHVTEILNLKAISRESATELRALIESLIKNVRVLTSMSLERNDMVDQILITLVCSRLDSETRKAYELHLPEDELPKYDDMMKFLQKRCHTLEAIASSKQTPERSFKSGAAGRLGTHKTTVLVTKVGGGELKCPNCHEGHYISQCDKFLALSPDKRLEVAKTQKLCYNCLSGSHGMDRCRRGRCRECNKKHHTLLHLPKNEENPEVNTLNVNLEHITTGQQVLVSTAVVGVFDVAGAKVFCRAFLDSCSQSNFMTEQLAQTLRVNRIPINLCLGGVLGMKGSVRCKAVAKIQSRTSDYSAELEFLVVPKIANGQNGVKFSKQKWEIPSHIELADPYFATPHRLDMLLGAEIFFDLWTSQNLTVERGLPPLRGSVFGWVVAGRVPTVQDQPAAVSTLCTFTSNEEDLLGLVKRFWEVESCHRPTWSIEEKQVEQHFMDTHRRQPDGRYIVLLPTKPNINKLGDSKKMALQRLQSLERRFARDRELRDKYGEFIREYEAMGHMKPSHLDMSQQSYDAVTYFLPHHAVLKPDAVSTKLRVVFDASACSTSGLSLNDVLKVGATHQQELFDILLRFRKHQIAFTSDITKMYRQVLVDEQHHPLQQILWREAPSDPVRAYSLSTVTYGTASAPFLATRALRQLALDEARDFPEASKIALTDFYVDDCLSGAQTIQDALKLKRQLIALMNRGGFPLHKWSANAPELLDEATEGDQTVNLSKYELVKTLGLKWHPSSDSFSITVDQAAFPECAVTKRNVLSDIARLFDPLGLVAPMVVTAKIFLQLLWSQSLDWDTPLSPEDDNTWRTFRDQLRELQQITVPRKVIPFANCQAIKLIGFCDASEAAYGCCLYVLCIDANGHRAARLLCSKSRIAPVKTITLPRLELCGAVLLAELIAKVRATIQIKFDQVALFTDSMIALGWIRSTPKKMKTFVGHRVAEIQDLTNPFEWRHVPTAENPADIVSRGLLPHQIQGASIWWTGPQFLVEAESCWPNESVIAPETSLPEMKTPKTTVLVTHDSPPLFPVLTEFSSFRKIQRIMANVQRFIANCKAPKKDRSIGALTGSEMTVALRHIVYAVQREAFSYEISKIEKGKVAKKSTLFNLNIFLDDQKILRVGGRIRKSNQPYDTKHQMILPRKHHVTLILLRSLHEQNGHIGQQGLLSIVRQTFWPVGARQMIKDVTQKCVRCYRCRPKLTEQFMGELPAYRTTIVHPFVNTGVDYAGPLLLKVNRRTTVKAYIAVFVCMAVKAVHLELVSDLSTDTFLAALTRFMSRRGHCKNIHSDNGTNFVGASNEIKRLLEDRSHQERVINACAPLQIDFHFIPPRAPHFGGLWEAAVKSAKHHLVRIVGNTRLNYEEMSTVLTKVEAILNSRPLLAESNDPEDPTSLTPGHFLIGRPLNALIERDYMNTNINRLQRWQIVKNLTQHFWLRWSREYLTSLQRRVKDANPVDIEIGAIVILKDENLPPTQWVLGKIVDLHPGTDGLVRVVSVKTKGGTVKRAVAKICLLPTSG